MLTLSFGALKARCWRPWQLPCKAAAAAALAARDARTVDRASDAQKALFNDAASCAAAALRAQHHGVHAAGARASTPRWRKCRLAARRDA